MRHIIKPHWLVPVHFKPWRLVRTVQKFLYGVVVLMQMPSDIYHAHDVNTLPACYVVARCRHKPLIFDAHELPLQGLESKSGSAFITVLLWLLACMISSCAGVVTVSLPIAQEMYRRYRAAQVTLVRNIPEYRTVLKTDRLRQALDLHPGVRIALYQGNLQADRSLDRLVHAAKFLAQDSVIVLMGKDIGGTQKQLEALIAEEDVADRVKILPSVPYATLLEWTVSADMGLLVYPPENSLNVKLCLPNKLFEYLMAGLPVLASPLDAVANLLQTYHVGRITPLLTPEAIGQAINSMLADRDGLARMHAQALRVAKQEFCWEKEGRRLVYLYCKVLKVVQVEGTDQPVPDRDERATKETIHSRH